MFRTRDVDVARGLTPEELEPKLAFLLEIEELLRQAEARPDPVEVERIREVFDKSLELAGVTFTTSPLLLFRR